MKEGQEQSKETPKVQSKWRERIAQSLIIYFTSPPFSKNNEGVDRSQVSYNPAHRTRRLNYSLTCTSILSHVKQMQSLVTDCFIIFMLLNNFTLAFWIKFQGENKAKIIVRKVGFRHVFRFKSSFLL